MRSIEDKSAVFSRNTKTIQMYVKMSLENRDNNGCRCIKKSSPTMACMQNDVGKPKIPAVDPNARNVCHPHDSVHRRSPKYRGIAQYRPQRPTIILPSFPVADETSSAFSTHPSPHPSRRRPLSFFFCCCILIPFCCSSSSRLATRRHPPTTRRPLSVIRIGKRSPQPPPTIGSAPAFA